MNETFLNSTEDVVGCLFLGGTTFSVCAYSIFLCYAIYDYQDEKPVEEKSPIDLLIKLRDEILPGLFLSCLKLNFTDQWLFSKGGTPNKRHCVSFVAYE